MLDIIDDTTQSKVLISSRVRDLLITTADDVTDVGLPTEAEAVSMLLSTAGVANLQAPPVEAFQIVRYCNLLPLAIGIAGRFLAEFGLSGGDSDWAGILTEIQEEFAQSDQTKNMEDHIIATSLKGLAGAQKSQIVALFHAMALLPEDQHCPLEVLPWLIHADSMDSANARPLHSVLRVRKWL